MTSSVPPSGEPVAQRRRSLRLAAAALRRGRITLGYLGGSITTGCEASDYDRTSYRPLVTRWFRDRFPAATIDEVNASFDGSGSWQGAYRVGRQLLDRHPDLVFVEFAVNDHRKDLPEISRSLEGIVRQIGRARPLADVVFVYTGMEMFEPFYREGNRPPSVVEHERVARHYGISSVDCGRALWNRMGEEGKDWEAYLPDKVHPNDEAFALYAGEIVALLEGEAWSDEGDGGTADAEVSLPARLNADAREHRRLLDAWELAAPGWTREETAHFRFPRCLTASLPGTELVVPFEGTSIGVYALGAPDSGDFEWSVDGSAPQRGTTWHPDREKRPWPCIAVLAELPPGRHELRLRILADRHEGSRGTVIRLGGLLLDHPLPAVS